MKTKQYNTMTEAISDLTKQGYTTDFTLLTDTSCIVCNRSYDLLSPEEFKIDSTYRFFGMTDPRDEMILYAISAIGKPLKGIVVSGYNIYAESSALKLVEDLSLQH